MGQATDFQHKLAAHYVRRGGVIAYATESVWGLGCDPFNEAAIEHLLALKQRPMAKGMILLSGQAEHFGFLVDAMTQEQRERLTQKSDRPTTWLVPDAARQVSPWIKGEHDFVAIRVSTSSSVAKLTKALGHPIISTSANPASKPTAKNILALRQCFGLRLDYILPGSVDPSAQASRIINIETGEIIRA